MRRHNSGFVMPHCAEFRALVDRYPKGYGTLPRAFWIEILMRANRCDGVAGEGPGTLALRRGRFVFGRDESAVVLRVGVGRLRKAIDRSAAFRELTTRSTNQGAEVLDSCSNESRAEVIRVEDGEVKVGPAQRRTPGRGRRDSLGLLPCGGCRL